MLLLAGLGAQGIQAQGQTTKESSTQPNILWISCEDISPNLGCYGDAASKTPVLDQLAAEGVRFTNAFTTVGVCAPSRSSIITGMYPASIGTHNMRTGKDITGISKGEYKTETGIVDPAGNSVSQYSAVIPADVKCFTEYLRKAGYYCTNNNKTDYQFAAPITAWDENDSQAHWRNRPKDKPFFSVFNLNVSHESQIWKKKKDPLLINPDAPQLPPYFPEDSIIRQDLARKYSNIAEMDTQVGEILQELKADGLLEKTIVVFFSDHGGPLPRGKRAIYDSGLKVPMIIRYPNQEKAGTTYDDMISFVDLAPSMLSLAGVKAPKYMQGQAFLGKYKTKSRTEIYGSRDRMDEFYDMVRCVRNKKFMYVRNFHPEWAYYQDIQYRRQLDMMNRLVEMHETNQLNKEQELWFRQSKPVEELYDVESDPFQLNNLAADPNYANLLKDMGTKLEKWQKDIGDKGFVPEGEMLRGMWPDLEQPQTIKPKAKIRKGQVSLTCDSKGASIAWQITENGKSQSEWKHWSVYDGPIALKPGQFLHAVAIRIGYKQSEEVVIRL